MQGWQRLAMRVIKAGAGLPAALLVALGCALPVGAQASVAIWPSGDGSRALVRNASGRPIMIDVPKALPPIATSGGAAALQASQSMNVGGASATFNLSRAISAANLARVARIGLGAAGPIAGLALLYDGLTWLNDEWNVSEVQSTYTAASGAYSANSQAAGLALYLQQTGHVGYLHAGTWGVSGQITMCRQSTPGNGCWFWSKAGETTTVDRPATEAELEAKFLANLQANPTISDEVVQAVSDFVPIEEAVPGSLQVTGPSSVQGPTETTVRQEGGNTYTTTNQTTYNITYQGDTVTVTATTNSTTVDQNSNVVHQSTTTTQAPASPEQAGAPAEDLECGLPGTPPCKIDETGTPQATNTVTAGQAALTAAFDARDSQVASSTQVESFGWLPTLPSLNVSCSTIQVGNIWTFDPCPGIEIGRTFFAFLWGFFGLIYAWRRVGETVAGGV